MNLEFDLKAIVLDLKANKSDLKTKFWPKNFFLEWTFQLQKLFFGFYNKGAGMKLSRLAVYTLALAILAANALIITLFHKCSNEKLVSETVKMLEAELGALGPVKAPEAGLALLITDTAAKHDIERSLLSCVLKVESTYDQSKVSATMDYGMAQINIQNIRRFKLDHAKVVNNTEYNVDFGASLLKHYQDLYKDMEPRTWACRYNVGTRSLTKVGAACEAYMSKLVACLTAGKHL